MKLSNDWHGFKAKLDKNYPRIGKSTQLSMDFGDEPDSGRGLQQRDRQLRRPTNYSLLGSKTALLITLPIRIRATSSKQLATSLVFRRARKSVGLLSFVVSAEKLRSGVT